MVVAGVALFTGCAKHLPPPARPESAHVEPPPPPPPKTDGDDGMKLEGQLGMLSDDAIAAAWKTRWADVTKCSRAAQARLAYVTGTVQLKLRVGADGLAKRVYVERSNLGSYDTEKCVLDIARTLQFEKPHGGSEAEFSYPIEVRPRPSSPWVVNWEEARVLPGVTRGKKDIGLCKGDVPPLRGKKIKRATAAPGVKALPASLELTLYIAPGGRVSSVGFAAEGPIDETFAACLSDRAKLWKLDDPRSQIAKATIGVSP